MYVTLSSLPHHHTEPVITTQRRLVLLLLMMLTTPTCVPYYLYVQRLPYAKRIVLMEKCLVMLTYRNPASHPCKRKASGHHITRTYIHVRSTLVLHPSCLHNNLSPAPTHTAYPIPGASRRILHLHLIPVQHPTSLEL